MFSAAAGIVMLAGGGDAHGEETLARSDFKAITEWTITDPDMVRARIAAARQDGYAISDQQSLPHEISTAAPVLDSDGKAIAAVQIAVYRPSWTLKDVNAKIVPLITELARTVSGTYFPER